MWAAAFGHVKVLKLLLDHGADPDWLLLIAIKRGHVYVVKMLLENGADANCREGCCVQVLASAVHHEAIFKLLLEHGAESKVREEGDILLVIAIKSGQQAVVQILVDLGLKTSNILDPIYTGATGGFLCSDSSFDMKLYLPNHKTQSAREQCTTHFANMMFLYLSFYMTMGVPLINTTISTTSKKP